MPCFPIPGDLALSADGRTLLFTTTEPQRVAQSIRTRAQIFKGSWRYDLNVGVPYFQEILVAGAGLDQVRRRFYDLFAETVGVVAVLKCDVVFDSAAETVRVEFQVSTRAGVVTDVLDFAAV